MTTFDLRIPASREEIARIQSERKKVAFAQARRAPFYAGKLDHVNPDRLDDPEEWAKIPVLDKEVLREIPSESFFEQFCVAPPEDIAELWRSGGTTGVPLFYPRTYQDMEYAYIGLARCWALTEPQPGDVCHMSFPLGIHPAGQLWARTANHVGVGVIWVGSGANTPSQLQLELIQRMQPSMWMGMPSYGLHLANLAEAQGIDLAGGSVRKVLVGAEALSAAKREKLERMWGAEVHDLFGTTEISVLGGDSRVHEGFHVWADQALFEVIDEQSGLPVPEGEEGLMVVTPLWMNNCTPFLRWSTGDIVTMRNRTSLDGPFSVFPVMRHAHRTAGFFKVRGINVNHSEFEDFMFRMPAVSDFKVVLETVEDREVLRVAIEVKRGEDAASVAETITGNIRGTFEVRPDVEVLETGTLAREFETSVKAPRFVDRRQ